MKTWKIVVTALVWVASLVWTIYCVQRMQHIADFYWLISIPTGVISWLGAVFGVVWLLDKWFEVT